MAGTAKRARFTTARPEAPAAGDALITFVFEQICDPYSQTRKKGYDNWMPIIPPYMFLIGAFIAWGGLMLTWYSHQNAICEHRRKIALARGETPPDIKGASNYERAALQESAHRAMMVTPRERWTGRLLAFGIPIIILGVFLINHPI